MATINGTFLPDILIGTADDDTISGFGGLDTIDGGAGNDIIDGGSGDDILSGGDGDDIIVGGTGITTLLSVYNGGDGNDVMFASDGGLEDFDGGAGIDTVSFAARDQGVSTVLALLGIPLFDVLRNVENVIGSAFNDEITGDGAANWFNGGDGNDILDGGAGSDTLIGGQGADTMDGGIGDDFFFVDNINDVVREAGGQGVDRVFASASYTLTAGAEVEVMSTDFHEGTAAINLTGNELANTIVGNDGDNFLKGGLGADILVGRLGNDFYFLDNAGDQVFEAAGQGSDRVFAGVSYTLAAGASVEMMTTDDNAGTAAINLTGNELANIIFGNAGDNVLNGGLGADTLVGNAGNDTFAFTTAPGGGNVDAIADFQSGADKIALGDAVFTAIGGLGVLNPNAFFAGTAAHDADDRIIYDQATGNLFYDADGNGAGAAVLFANLSSSPVLTASDFVVI